MTHVSGLHRECLDLYFKRYHFNPNDMEFGVNSFAVESAYALRSSSTLLKLAAICAEKMMKHAGDITSGIELCRTLWRLVCLAARSKQELEKTEIIEALSQAWAQLARVCPAAESITLNTFVRRTRLFILHASRADDGEMMFFKFCVAQGLLRQPTLPAAKETYLLELLKTCRRGGFSETAIEYFTAAQRESGTESMSQAVLFRMLQVLSGKNKSQKGAALKLAREVIQSSSNSTSDLPIVFWFYVVNAAAAEQDVEMSRFIADFVIQRSLDSKAPLRDEDMVFACLQAVARCGVKDFLECYLRPCLSAGIITAGKDGDAITTLMLYYCLECADGEPQALQLLKNPNVSLTMRVATLAVNLLTRADSDEYLTFYKIFTGAGVSLFRLSWLEDLISWADRRRYSLGESDRQYILTEVNARVGFVDVESDVKGLEGVRSSLAMLKHDSTHRPLTSFLNDGSISPPPKLLDTRLQFLMKRSFCVDTDSALIITQNRKHQQELDISADDSAMAATTFASYCPSLREEDVREYLQSKVSFTTQDQCAVLN